MSATNSTPNYDLPQYVADDKPTYLGDFNKAMLDIDTNMKTIDNKATSAEGQVSTAVSTANQAIENANQASTKADTAQATATQAQTTATTAKNTADTAKSTADTAKSTADTANETATQANTLAQQVQTALNNIKNNWTEAKNIIDSALSGNGYLYCSYNKDLNIISLFGRITFNRDNPNNIIIGTLPSEIKPSTERTITNGLTPVYPIGESGDGAGIPADLVINTQGQIVLYNNNVGAPARINYGFVQLMLNASEWYN